MKTKWMIVLFLCVLLLAACRASSSSQEIAVTNMEGNVEIDELSPTPMKTVKPIEVKITAVGDIMVHGPQLRAQHNGISGLYDFNNNFRFVKPYIASADLALFNLETTFAGEEKGYSSFPRFNSPDSLAHALKAAGFDVAVTANNHTIDTGLDGVLRTLEVLQLQGLKPVGTREANTENRFLIEDVKGIKIGITAYTYETPAYGKNKTINGLILPSKLESLVNSYCYDRWEEDLVHIKSTIDAMKDSGAEIIILYIHWGEEFQRMPNHSQRRIVQDLNACGVHIVLGSHPHVLQPLEWIKHNDHKTLVVYSLGNFLSNQRYEIMKNRHTEDGMLVHITIQKNLNSEITISQVSYQPTWVHKYAHKGKGVFEILPLPQALENPEGFQLLTDASQYRAKLSFHNTSTLLQSESPAFMLFDQPKINSSKNDIE